MLAVASCLLFVFCHLFGGCCCFFRGGSAPLTTPQNPPIARLEEYMVGGGCVGGVGGEYMVGGLFVRAWGSGVGRLRT